MCGWELVKVLWLASTDAVLHGEYEELLKNCWSQIDSWVECITDCPLPKLNGWQPKDSLKSFLLRTLLSNECTPDSILYLFLEGDHCKVDVCITLDFQTYHVACISRDSHIERAIQQDCATCKRFS